MPPPAPLYKIPPTSYIYFLQKAGHKPDPDKDAFIEVENKPAARILEARGTVAEIKEIIADCRKDGIKIGRRKPKPTADPVKSSRLRRTRGYSFEYDLVQKFKATENWDARRLGGSSTGLPDVVATNNYKGILMVIECKSGDTNLLKVPDDQVQRCFDTAKLFGFYDYRYVIFAFKFKKNKERGRPKLEYRYLVIEASRFTKITGLEYSLKSDLGWFWYKTRDGSSDGTHFTTIHSFDLLIDKILKPVTDSTLPGRI